MVKAKHIWFYGAGKIGARVAKQCSSFEFSTKVEGFAVTRRIDGAESIEGFSIKEIIEIETPKDETLFILTVAEKFRDEIVTELNKRGYKNWLIWDDKVQRAIWHLCTYSFLDNKRDMKKVCFVLCGYKEFLWEKVFLRLRKFLPQDVEVCLLSSGLRDEKLEKIANEENWSYLSTDINDLTLIQNIGIVLFDNAYWFYKMDEDIFLTEKCFEKMYEMYQFVQEKEPYHVGLVGPTIPVNGFGYRWLLENFGKLQAYEERFEKAYWGGLLTHKLECDPKAAQFMWGGTDEIPQIDVLNKRLSDEKKYSVCGVRYSIGFILYTKDMWELMEGFGVTGTIDMGRDERDFSYWCMIKSRAIVVAHNVAVGHFSFGPQTDEMKTFYKIRQDLFDIQEV